MARFALPQVAIALQFSIMIRSRSFLISLAIAFVFGAVALASQVSADNENDLLKKADIIAKRVVKIRGLAQKRPIERGVMQKDQIRKRLLKRIDEEYTPAELAAEELALKRLGLLTPDTDYKKTVIELLTDQIAGFYDPTERRLYIAGWQTGGGVMDEMLMAHEIDHALQDQHFDLLKFMKPGKENSDAAVARQALVEGDGTALMVEYMMRKSKVSPWKDDAIVNMMTSQLSGAMGDELDKAPLVLREGLVFPYMQGLSFVVHFRRKHPWSRIDDIYRKPPLSTEHVLHPAKYLSYERPDEITPRSLPALRGYRQVFSNINGELGLTILLRQHTPQGNKKAIIKKAKQAAAGWGGDRLAIYTPPGHKGKLPGTVGISYSVWDNTADAIELFEMLSDAMPSLSGGKAVKDGPEYVEYAAPDKSVFAAQRRNDAVVLVLGAPQDKARAILDQVWQRWKVRRR